MSSLDELMNMQNQQMGAIYRTLTNFKKLEQTKITRTITRQRLATLKETFARCQEMDCKIMLAADEKLKTIHAYFTQNYFLTFEDCFHEAVDYMAGFSRSPLHMT